MGWTFVPENLSMPRAGATQGSPGARGNIDQAGPLIMQPGTHAPSQRHPRPGPTEMSKIKI